MSEGLASRNIMIVTVNATAAGKTLADGSDPSTVAQALCWRFASQRSGRFPSPDAATLEAMFAARNPRLERAIAAAEKDTESENGGLPGRAKILLPERTVVVVP